MDTQGTFTDGASGRRPRVTSARTNGARRAASSSRTIDLRRDDRPLRIGIIAPPFVPTPPVNYGGTEIVIDTLARGLARAGQDVVLYATGDSTCPVARRWHHDVAQGTSASLLSQVAHVEAAYEALSDCDVIHDHSLVGPLVAHLAGAPQIPVTTTIHRPIDAEVHAHLRLLAERVSLVTVSRAQQAAVPELRSTTIHHGIDTGRMPIGRGQGGYALFVGRMSPEKGVHLAIDAARQAGVHLRIAAKMWQPEEKAYFEQEVRPRLGPDVEHLGVVTRLQRNVLMSRATAVVNPISWPEPFGLVMIEALATGTPVVALANGSAPEIIEHGTTGFLSADVDEMAEHLRAAASLDRTACRRAATSRFSASAMVERHLAHYRELVGRVTVPELASHRTLHH